MKFDVSEVRFGTQWDSEGLNSAIQIHVIESILIVPDSSRRVGYFVAHKPNPVVTWVGCDLADRRARPRLDGRLHSECVTYWRKCEIGSAAHAILTVRGVVRHVALRRMRLAPGVFTRGHILGFSEVARALIKALV